MWVSHYLDDRSRQILRTWIFSLLCIAGFVVIPCLLGSFPPGEVCIRLSNSFVFAGFALIILALLRRERAGEGSLNSWDQSVAFNGVAVLVHLLNRLGDSIWT